MIIDLRTRIWSSLDQFGSEVGARLRRKYADRWDQLDGSPAAHERAMACVDGACIFGFRSAMLGAAVPNELVAEFVARDQRRRIGVAGIDPMSPDASDELEKAIHLGLAGITVSPGLQGFHPAHSRAMRLYERCQEAGLPLFVAHDMPLPSGAMLEFARPLMLDEVARSIPKLKIVIGDFGYPWMQETIALISKHPNVYADVAGICGRAWELYNALLSAFSNDVMEKILFGSAFPFVMPSQAIETLYSLNSYSHGTQLPSIPRSQIRGIVERDGLACLGMESEVLGATASVSAALPPGEGPIATRLVGATTSENGEASDHEE